MTDDKYVFPGEEYYARPECEEAVPELAWRSLRSASRQTGERLANQDGVLLIDLTPMGGGGIQKTSASVPRRWINLLKRGANVSVGCHDATVNIGRKGVRQTFGLPGTGLSYTTWRILYRGDPGMGIVLLIFSAIILILAHAICASGANPEPITPPRDASLAWRRTLTHSICMEIRPWRSG